MNHSADPLQRYKKQVISTVFGFNLVFGALVVIWFPGLIDPATSNEALAAIREGSVSLAYQFITLLLCFLWLSLDSRQLDIRRPWWLNVGIVFLAAVFVPYYLYKTRPVGLRVRSIAVFFGIFLGSALSMSIGAIAAMIVMTPPVAGETAVSF